MANFQPEPLAPEPPGPEQLQTLLTRIIKRVLRVLTRKGALIEGAPENPYLADTDRDPALAPLQELPMSPERVYRLMQ